MSRSLPSDTTEQLHFHCSLSCIGEGNGNPLQCSCLENPRDGGAWWSAVYGVTQSWTRLRRLRKKKNPNQRCRPPIIAISQVLCLERLQSQTHFLRFETKLSQVCVCVCVCVCVLLFPELHITFQFYQGFSLLEDYVKLLFCVTPSFNMTRIHFSTERPLVKIL